ncbi:pyridoxine 5'-phosphate synthase [Sneathiella sp.]|uniref:pyridoxine 5'-phosphate synthase n=1 Tax=Sneathiella sp. TaxID=1964365 RepID=UPI00261BC3F2|nr:pyridoxine 5'-phosphate synthase [Sneathiella sp.]MDF2366014.1 pyridoxine 5'-phosphate synthase [Sneathiella sp.]
MKKLRLGINIDHVATIRNARGGVHPDPLRAARIAEAAGADGITAHLREDRRHISDGDITRLAKELTIPLNFEMAATKEMLDIALSHKPHASCLVPEKREERTTEGGLDVAGGHNTLQYYVESLKGSGIRVSLFIEADPRQIEASHRLGADIVEIHTGAYCDADDPAQRQAEFDRIQKAAALAEEFGLECHAGHGLTYGTVSPIAAIPTIVELNIGHFLIGEAIFSGLEPAMLKMRKLMDDARQAVA